jgi:histidine triad (HIT) family protein
MSAQLFAAAVSARPGIPAEIAPGEFGGLREWLRQNVGERPLHWSSMNPDSSTFADGRQSDKDCAFCKIANGEEFASIVTADDFVLSVMDVRQFHPGHVLVIPRQHVSDVRFVDIPIAEAVMRAIILVARAISATFPSDGLSVWHSAGAGANQEIPHLHFHVHPRLLSDDLLRVYPVPAPHPSRDVLDTWAVKLRAALNPGAAAVRDRQL